MGPTESCGFPVRIVQIHPTRRCNLRCLHCYSHSGPGESEELPVSLLQRAVTDASEHGYTVLGLSGGEPVLYRELPRLLEHARTLGMVTTVTSNGMLLDQRRLRPLVGVTNLLAISLDGIPESHNQIRGCHNAFQQMASRLELVRASGIPFGFIFTLTQNNLHELGWLAEFAVEQGATLLQIHPLEQLGRATALMPEASPDEMESAHAFLEAARIQELYGDRLYVQFDLTDRDILREEPCRGFAGQPPESPLLAHWVSPLVIEQDGMVVPVRYGFPRRFALGNLHEAPLRLLAEKWQKQSYRGFRAHCRKVFAEVTIPSELPFFNWYEAVSRSP